jgi:Pyruvate/2-oxoacid:ferredoxin oxidoreductase delta subunit
MLHYNIIQHQGLFCRYSPIEKYTQTIQCSNCGFFCKSHSERSLWIRELHIPGEMRCTPSAD